MKRVIALIGILLFIPRCTDTESLQPTIESEMSIGQLNDLLQKELATKRIVMLGDGWHGHGHYLRKVTDFLNYWLDNIESQSAVQLATHSLLSKLVLFLECDSTEQELIYGYIRTGDIQTYLTHAIDWTVKYGGWEKLTIDRIEFLYDLREIQQRIDKLNQRNPECNARFLIRGAESDPWYLEKANDWTFMRTQFARARFDWFANKRDEKSSGNIRTFLDNNPDYKALVFYGTAHLLRGKRKKEEPILRKSKTGYYLAHYLDNYFGRNNVAVFHTYHSFDNRADFIEKVAPGERFPDFMVCYRPIPSYPCPLYLFPTQSTIVILRDLLKTHGGVGDENDKNYGMRFSLTLLEALQRSYLNLDQHYRTEFDTLYDALCIEQDSQPALQRVIKIGDDVADNFDAIKNLKEIDDWIALTNDKFGRYYGYLFKNVLSNFASQSNPSAVDSAMTVAELFNEQHRTLSKSDIQRAISLKDELLEYALIEMLWIGNAGERQKALAHLRQSTNLDYKIAREWSQFWRHKFVAATVR